MKMRKWVSLFLTAALVASFVPGCSKTETDKGQTQEKKVAAETPEPPTEISVMTMLWEEPPDIEKSPFYQEFMKRTNTKLTIQMIPSTAYTEKLTLALASRQLPDLVTCRDLYLPAMVNYISQGAFADVGQLLGDFSQFKNLKNIRKEIWDNAKVNGKTYSVPNPRGLAEQSIQIRKDWLDTLGLPVPATLDEYTDALRAFVKKDPDKNGKDDTIGLYVFGASMGAAGSVSLAGAFGVNKPVTQDDKLLFHWMTDGYKDYIAYMRGLYAEGILSKEYVILKNNDVFYQGKYGSIGSSLTTRYDYETEIKKTVPSAQIVTVPPLKGPNGYASTSSIGYFGNYMIPSAVNKEKALKILAFLDKTYTQEISDLRNYGIEGMHHKVVDGKKVLIEDAYKKDVGNIHITVGLYDPYVKTINLKAPDSVNEEQKKMADLYVERSGPREPAEGLVSATYAGRGNELFKERDTLITKVVMGEAPLQDWTKYVEKMKADADVQKMMKEFYAQYKLKSN